MAMADVSCLYIDDSGSRRPDRHPKDNPEARYDFFGLGGVLVREEDKPDLEARHKRFCDTWEITYPLHSTEIRNGHGNFSWLRERSKADRDAFYTSLGDFILSLPIICVAAVIDRPGYNSRYKERYGQERWRLCKTAFSVLVERAARLTLQQKRRLRIFPENCGKKEDRSLERYYDELLREGMPFDKTSSGKYAPLTPEEFRSTLYEFKIKSKKSAAMQIADMVLHPVCLGGYDATHRPYMALRDGGLLLDCHLEPNDIPMRGIKYSCFDLVTRKT